MSKFFKSRKAKQSVCLFRAMESLENRRLLASAPIVITQGGTYSGDWESQDYRTPVITIKTSQPVIIQNSTLRGRGDLISSTVSNANITVRNTSGYGLNPNVAGRVPGRFLTAYQFDNIDVENNYLEGTSGIYLQRYVGDRSGNETIKVLDNKAKNIDGRKSNGNGGFMDFNDRRSKSGGSWESGYELVQFLQFNDVIGVPGVDIGWNQVINEVGLSRVEDNISIFKSSGTSSSPIKIHDNYIDGAYTIKPWMSNTSDSNYDYDWGFSGGGIMLGDGVGTSVTDPAYVDAYNNTVISTTNYGIAIAAGHDMEAYGNRIFSSGKLDDGQTITAQNVGLYIWDSSSAGSSHFYNNIGHDNVAGWMLGSSHNEYWTPGAASFTNNTKVSTTITSATEAAELAAWQQRFLIHDPGATTNPVPNDPVPTDPVPTDPDPVPTDPDPVPTNPDPVPTAQVISGTVFNDADKDRVFDSGESGVSGRTVYLDLNDNRMLDSTDRSTVTNASGKYAFSVAPGGYVVRQALASGWYQTSPSNSAGISAGVVANSTVAGSFNFGTALSTIAPTTDTGSISGSVFRDSNESGYRGSSESGMSGVIVYIDANNNGWRDASERTATTDSNGAWTFDNLADGTYRIRVVKPSSWLDRTTASYFMYTVSGSSAFTGDNFGFN